MRIILLKIAEYYLGISRTYSVNANPEQTSVISVIVGVEQRVMEIMLLLDQKGGKCVENQMLNLALKFRSSTLKYFSYVC